MSLAWIGVAGIVVGAGTSIYAANKSSGDAAKARSTAGELGNLPYDEYLKRANAAADSQFDLNSRQAQQTLDLYPEFAQATRDAQAHEADLMLDYYPKFAKAERTATSAQRGGDLADMGRYGSGFKDLYGKLSSGYAGLDGALADRDHPLMDRLNSDALGTGPSEIRTRLASDALSELKLGRELSPDQEREIAQSVRAAYSDRGMARGNPAIVSEVLARDAAGTARQRERQQFAGGVQTLALGEDAQNHGFQMGVENLNESEHGNRVNQLIAGQNAQLGPILGAFTRTGVSTAAPGAAFSLAPGAGLPAQVMASGPTIAGGAGVYNPLLTYGADAAGANFAATNNANINSANAYAAIGGGLMNLGGKAATSYGSGATQPAVGSVNQYGGTYEGMYGGKPVYAASRA